MTVERTYRKMYTYSIHVRRPVLKLMSARYYFEEKKQREKNNNVTTENIWVSSIGLRIRDDTAIVEFLLYYAGRRVDGRIFVLSSVFAPWNGTISPPFLRHITATTTRYFSDRISKFSQKRIRQRRSLEFVPNWTSRACPIENGRGVPPTRAAWPTRDFALVRLFRYRTHRLPKTSRQPTPPGPPSGNPRRTLRANMPCDWTMRDLHATIFIVILSVPFINLIIRAEYTTVTCTRARYVPRASTSDRKSKTVE